MGGQNGIWGSYLKKDGHQFLKLIPGTHNLPVYTIAVCH